MTLGDVIATFGEYIWELRPWRVISVWEQGVRVRLGQANKLLTSTNGLRGTGLHLVLPGFDQVVTTDASIEVVESTVQSCTTLNGESVSFNLALRYQVTDAKRAYETIYDVGHTVLIQARASAGDCCGTLDNAQLSEDGEDFGFALSDAVSRDISGRLRDWGIELHEVSLSTCVFCRTYRVIGYHSSGIGGGD